MSVCSTNRKMVSLLLPSTVMVLSLISCVMSMNFNYCQISPSHTLCQYSGLGRTCPAPIRRGVSDGDKQQIVAIHNKLRSQVALGQEGRGRPGPQPPAADMLALRWDDELAAVAQRWADQCQFGHDTVRDVSRFKVGQNVYIHAHTLDGPVPWRQGIMSFYDEVKIHNNRDTSRYSFLPSTGHYTQMVWAKTSTIGCGSTSWREGRFIKQYLVCNYGPSGNFLGAPMYEIGQSCSRCPRGTSCSNGLCSGSASFSGTIDVPSAPIAQPPISQPTFSNNRPSISVGIAPTRRPSSISFPTSDVQFGFVPMGDNVQLQDPRPVQRPILATNNFEPVNNDISVQNLLNLPQANPPPPALILQQRPINIQRPSSTRPQPPRRPNCRGMFAFMCNLFG